MQKNYNFIFLKKIILFLLIYNVFTLFILYTNNVNFKTDNSGEFKVVSKQYFGGMYQIEVSNNKNIQINLMSDETISNGIKIGDSLSLSIESKDIIFLEDK